MDLVLIRTRVPEKFRAEYLRATVVTLGQAAQSDLRSEALVTEAFSEGYYRLLIGLVLDLEKATGGLALWLVYFTQYDPGGNIAQIHCPVLALNGSLDRQVLADKRLPVIEQSLPTGIPRQVCQLEGLNRLLQHTTTGTVSEYYQISETVAPEVLGLIAEWLTKLTK